MNLSFTGTGSWPAAAGPLAAVQPEDVKPGWLGLFVVLALCLVTFLLWRSMNRQLRKVDFEEQPDDGDGSAPADHTEEPESGDQPEEGPRTSQP